jgi:hypothetical protein
MSVAVRIVVGRMSSTTASPVSPFRNRRFWRPRSGVANWANRSDFAEFVADRTRGRENLSRAVGADLKSVGDGLLIPVQKFTGGG